MFVRDETMARRGPASADPPPGNRPPHTPRPPVTGSLACRRIKSPQASHSQRNVLVLHTGSGADVVYYFEEDYPRGGKSSATSTFFLFSFLTACFEHVFFSCECCWLV